jgi:hypothetical protein
LEVIHPKIYQNSLGYYTEPLKEQVSQMTAEIETARKALLTAQNELVVVQNTLLEAQNEIAAMKTSKFWRLRSFWFRLKQRFLKTGGLS